ncbi:MAG: ABC transporter permease [Betaproteobacteria bacterium]|nr:ABC transporter permease [Betaproteobacteria bacterium]
MIAAFSWRLLGRELRSGELRLLFAALVVAVAAVTAVGFVGDRVGQGLQREAQQMMGGDLVVTSDHPLPERYREEARRHNLAIAETLLFPSMVMAAGQAHLADIKAVSSTYPLRGKLGTSERYGEADRVTDRGPPSGSLWPDERLASALGIAPGDNLRVGSLDLRVGAILTREPDRGINFFSLAPRLMMNAEDLGATGLVQFGARIRYNLLLAGNDRDIKAYRKWLEKLLERGERLEDAGNARPEIRSVLDRSERFLGLATLLTVILSAVAAATAARRYMQRHLDACAIMRCLGMTHGRLLRFHAVLFLWLALLAGVVGSATGFVAHFILMRWLVGLLALDLPPAGWLPLAAGLGVAGVLLFGFAFPPLLQLARVPTLRVLRRELGPPRPFLLGGYLLGMLLLSVLIVWVAGDLHLGLLAVAGFGGALLGFWLIARLFIAAVSRWRDGFGFGWRQGLASLSRHASSGAIQAVALSIGLMAMLLLTVVRGDLLTTWQNSVPSNAPNRFIINIQPEQRTAVADELRKYGVVAELLPMVRARLVQIGGHAVSPASYPEDERAQRLIEREFNLSWRADMPDGNRSVAGQWFTPEQAGQGLASVEDGLAKTLGISMGDELVFVVAGIEKRLRVTNLRKLAWDSMRVNFFVLAPPGVIDDAPASYITSFHLPPEHASAASELVKKFPNLTLIDVEAVLRQLQSIVGQVASAVQFVFVFTLLAGVIVLYSTMLTAFDERRYELAVMRALGAQHRQLGLAMQVELAIIGALAGLFAAGGAVLLGKLVSRQVFQLELDYSIWLLPASALGGGMLSVAIGWLGIRRLLATPPLQALRQGV